VIVSVFAVGGLLRESLRDAVALMSTKRACVEVESRTGSAVDRICSQMGACTEVAAASFGQIVCPWVHLSKPTYSISRPVQERTPLGDLEATGGFGGIPPLGDLDFTPAGVIQARDIGLTELPDDLCAGAVASCGVAAGAVMFGVNFNEPVSISEKQALELKNPHARSPEPFTIA
jgi:hypothetical protein